MKKMQSAEDFYDLHHISISFKIWREHTILKAIERKEKNHKATSHNTRYMIKIVFHILWQVILIL